MWFLTGFTLRNVACKRKMTSNRFMNIELHIRNCVIVSGALYTFLLRLTYCTEKRMGNGSPWTNEDVKALVSVWAEANIQQQLDGAV